MRSSFDVADERVRTVLADVDILSRPNIIKLENLLSTMGQKYKCFVVSTRYADATTDDCARAAASNLELLVDSANQIVGYSDATAKIINRNLSELVPRLSNFKRAQPADQWGERLATAIALFLSSTLAQPDVAGSAFRRNA